ncbi:MAG: ABC transporter ATP-binding protein [Pseudomonadota bacterium]
MAELRLDALSFAYPGADAATLSDLTLTVERGEAHALLGSSGAGKTTLLNLLSGLLPAAPGQIYFDGRDVGARAPYERRVTQVFQFPVLYDAMTVAENLAFPMRKLPVAERQGRLRDVAERLGLGAALERKPRQLTLVEKQLTAIGKALLRPDVALVLLDEPLTAAEPEHKWRLRQTLKALQHELEATMIYVTHDQTEALTFADRVSVLHEGRILQTGTPAALVADPAHEHVGYFVGSPGMNLLDGEIRGGALMIGAQTIGVQAAGTLESGALDAGAATGSDQARADVAESERVALSDGNCRIGFRPEWARITQEVPAETSLSVEVLRTRTLATDRGEAVGLVTAVFQGREIVTRQPLGRLAPGRAALQLDADRLCLFRDGRRLKRAG